LVVFVGFDRQRDSVSGIKEEFIVHPISLRRKDIHQGEKTNPVDLASATNALPEETIWAVVPMSV
jgi:hypothetical protein